MIRKVAGIKVAERVFSILDDSLELENGNRLSAYLTPFNNCREVGYYLTVSDHAFDNPNRVKEDLFIYVCEARNSDEIMIVVQTDYPTNQGMFSEKAYNCQGEFDYRKYFHYNEEHVAANWIYEEIKKFFKL